MSVEREKWHVDHLPYGYPLRCDLEQLKEIVQDLNDEYVIKTKNGKNNVFWERAIKSLIESGSSELTRRLSESGKRISGLSMDNVFVYVVVTVFVVPFILISLRQTPAVEKQAVPVVPTTSMESSEDTSGTATESPVDLSSIPAGERVQLLQAARDFIRAGSTGFPYDLILTKRVGNWIIFSVEPKHNETDPAALFMERVNGVWEGRALGTAFPDLYEQHPELFN